MIFCPKCGSILRPKVDKGRKALACSCGFVDRTKQAGTIKEHVSDRSEKVEVVDKEENILPKTKVQCPKCGHDTAFYWTIQTRAGDEPETKFLKCEKCKHTWRDYS